MLAGRLAPVAIWTLLAAPAPAAGQPLAAVDSGRLRGDLEALASDDMEGRDVGTDGIRRAEEHVARGFAAAGLKPLGGQRDHYFDFPVYRDGWDERSTLVEIRAGGVRRLEPGVDFEPLSVSTSDLVEAPLVFAGYGITAPELGWDDYEDLDVKGRVVLVLSHSPGEGDTASPFAGAEAARHATIEGKADNARAHGAIGMVLVTEPLHHEGADDFRLHGRPRLTPVAPARSEPVDGGNQPVSPPLPAAEPAAAAPAAADAPAEPLAPAQAGPAPPPKKPSYYRARGPRPRAGRRGTIKRTTAEPPAMPSTRFAAVHVSREIGEHLADTIGHSLRRLQRMVDAGTKPASFASAATVRMRSVKRAAPETVRARNVVGVLPGRDPRVRDEIVVIGAHHDHLGSFRGAGDTIYNGADDNASGTAAVMELARAFSAAGTRPRRTLVFVTFTGEERGLLGSKALVGDAMFPLERVAFMVNMDMIGRNADRPLQVIGDGFGSGASEHVEAAAAATGLPVQRTGAAYFSPSDHDSFYREGVPFLFLFSDVHEDYHRVGDEADKIAWDRYAQVVRFARDLVQRLADADEMPRFVQHLAWLGAAIETVPQPDGGERAVVTSVRERGRAAAAGMRAGDVLVAVDGQSAGARQAAEILRDVAPGRAVPVTVERDGRRVDVEVVRARPGYLGIVSGDVDPQRRRALALGEDEGLLVREVIADSPASRVGIEPGDILARIAGEPVTQRTLPDRLARVGAGEDVDLLLVRDGIRFAARATLTERARR